MLSLNSLLLLAVCSLTFILYISLKFKAAFLLLQDGIYGFKHNVVNKAFLLLITGGLLKKYSL